MFESYFQEFQATDYRITVYRSDGPTDIEEWFDAHGVTVEQRHLPPGGPDPFVVLEADGEFVGSLGVTALEGLLEPPLVRPTEREGVTAGYSAVFDLIDDTLVRGMTRRELLAVSREIEDRAYRVGRGTLRVSFQTLSTFESQADVYRTLATDTDLDIHIYGVADWKPPEIRGVTYHGQPGEGIDRHWVLAFDGGTDETQACGLLAREQADGYDGVWTNDPEQVAEIATTLAESDTDR
ncbi:DICT sensory domain-containing protein [Halapricum desulfuricans]|nr:DICT sensory domain-containing protein [Halapricum desulfuricans]